MLIVLLIRLNICMMKKGQSIYEPDFLSISVTFQSLLRPIVNFISTKSLGYLVKNFTSIFLTFLLYQFHINKKRSLRIVT
jgi:hypothetical protein